MNTLNLISFYRPTDAVRRGGWVESLFVLAQKLIFLCYSRMFELP